MAEFLLMPQATPTMTVGVLAKWTVPEGGDLVPQSVIAAVETDKATMDIEYFDKGVLLKHLAKEGDEIPPGRPIAIIGKTATDDISALVAEYAKMGAAPAPSSTPAAQPLPSGGQVSPSDGGEVPAAPPAPAAAAAAAPALPPTGGGAQRAEGGPAATPAPTAAPAPAPAQTPGKTPLMSWAGKPIDEAIMEPRGVYVPASARRAPVSPLARAVADDLGVKLDRVTGTGPGGRVVRADVETAAKAPVVSAPTHVDTSKRITQMRKTIARRLTDVHQQVPVFYLTVTFDMNAMVALKASAAAQDIKVSYNDLLLKAVARGLRDVPEVNSAWMGDSIVERGSVDIGVAVALPEGLITPIIRNADGKSVTAIAAEIRELAGRAKAGKLQAEEYTGGSFTISNLGMLDIESFTAILNPPEAAILALGAVEQVPVVVDGQLAVGWRLKATMTCDHRVVDGALGARFLQALRRYVESPAMLVL